MHIKYKLQLLIYQVKYKYIKTFLDNFHPKMMEEMSTKLKNETIMESSFFLYHENYYLYVFKSMFIFVVEKRF